MDHVSILRWFDLTVPPLLIVGLPLMNWFIPSRPASNDDSERIRRLTFLVWLVALVSVAVYYVAYFVGGGGQWRQLWMLAFLQMPLFQRLATAKNSGYGEPHVGPTRAAVLTNRATESTIPFVAWCSIWCVWALFLLLAVVGYFRNDLPPRLGMAIGMFLAMSATFLALGPLLVKQVSREPEPLDRQSSPDLVAAYKRHRIARRWLFFSLPATLVLMFGGCAALIAWLATDPHREASIGLYGGAAGAVVGCAGGIVGIVFGVWRARLNRLASERIADDAADTAG